MFNITGENPALSPWKMTWAVLLISLKTGFSPTNGKPREMHSLWSRNSILTRHDTPEKHADDALLPTPSNSVYEQTIYSRAGLDPCGFFQIRTFYDSV